MFTVTNISKNGSESTLCSSVTVTHTCTHSCKQRASDLRSKSSDKKEEFNSPIVDYLTVAAWHDFDTMGFTWRALGRGSTRSSYQRSRGSARVNRKFSQ